MCVENLVSACHIRRSIRLFRNRGATAAPLLEEVQKNDTNLQVKHARLLSLLELGLVGSDLVQCVQLGPVSTGQLPDSRHVYIPPRVVGRWLASP